MLGNEARGGGRGMIDCPDKLERALI